MATPSVHMSLKAWPDRPSLSAFCFLPQGAPVAVETKEDAGPARLAREAGTSSRPLTGLPCALCVHSADAAAPRGDTNALWGKRWPAQDRRQHIDSALFPHDVLLWDVTVQTVWVQVSWTEQPTALVMKPWPAHRCTSRSLLCLFLRLTSLPSLLLPWGCTCQESASS